MRCTGPVSVVFAAGDRLRATETESVPPDGPMRLRKDFNFLGGGYVIKFKRNLRGYW